MKKNISFYNFSLRASSINTSERCWFAHFKIDSDFSHLFPFIKSVLDDVTHYEFPEYIEFKLHNISCSLYPPDTVVSRLFYGREQALEFAHSLIEFMSDLEVRKDQIKPVFQKCHRLYVPDILRFLPMTNCGYCGYKTCMAFAGAICRRKATLSMCPDFPEPVETKIIYLANGIIPEKTNRIEVDPVLAGIVFSKNTQPLNKIEPQLAPKKRKKHAKGLTGNREGIVFKLSGRELEVLRLITEGFTNKEIARLLNISPNTTKSHVVHIFNKLGINDRTQAAVWAAQNELI